MLAHPTTQVNRKPSELDRLLRTRSYRWAYRKYRRVCFYRKVTAQIMDHAHHAGKSTAAADLIPVYNRLCDIEDRMRANKPALDLSRPWTTN
jgi:nitroreductase